MSFANPGETPRGEGAPPRKGAASLPDAAPFTR